VCWIVVIACAVVNGHVVATILKKIAHLRRLMSRNATRL